MRIKTKMSGNDLAARIKTSKGVVQGPFQVSEKSDGDSDFPRPLMLKGWKRERSYTTVEEVAQDISTHCGDSWLFIKQRSAFGGGTVYTFEAIPHRDSAAARNPGVYGPDYLQIKVNPPVE